VDGVHAGGAEKIAEHAEAVFDDSVCELWVK